MKISRLSTLRIITTTLFLGVSSSVLAQSALTSSQVTKMLSTVETIFTEQQIVGMQGAIFDGEQVHTLNLGYADLEHQVPVASNTRFEIASITKAFTGLGQLMLAESGELDLDKPVHEYVPEFPQKPGGPITTRQLSGATSGIRHYQSERDVEFYATHYDSVIEALDLFKDDPLVVAPGSQSHYSSYGFNLMAAVIERAGGQPFTEAITEMVIAPMGLENTGFNNVQLPLPNRSRHYTFIDLFSREVLPTLHVLPTLDHSYNMGGGNMYSTASDLVHFGRQLLVPGVLSENVIAQINAPHTTSTGEYSEFSDGWVMFGMQGEPQFLMAGGSYPGTLALLLVYPEINVVAAMVSNTWGKDGPNVMDRLIMEWASAPGNEL